MSFPIKNGLLIVGLMLSSSLASAQVFTQSGAFSVGVESGSSEINLYQGYVGFDVSSDGQCVSGFVDIDTRPLLGKNKVRDGLRETVIAAIETQVRLALSKATGKAPADVVIPAGLLESKIDTFQVPGVNAVGVDQYVQEVVSKSAVTDAAIRQLGISVKLNGCNDEKGQITLSVGKLDPLYFNAESYYHPFNSEPTVRAIVNLSDKVSLFTQISSQRLRGVDDDRGDSYGYVEQLVQHAGEKVLKYNADSVEGGVILNSPIGQVIGAVARKSDDAVYGVVDFQADIAALNDRNITVAIQVSREEGRQENSGDVINRFDVLASKGITKWLTIWTEYYQKTGTLASQRLNLKSILAGVDARVKAFGQSGEMIVGGNYSYSNQSGKSLQGVMRISWGNPRR